MVNTGNTAPNFSGHNHKGLGAQFSRVFGCHKSLDAHFSRVFGCHKSLCAHFSRVVGCFGKKALLINDNRLMRIMILLWILFLWPMEGNEIFKGS